MDGFFIYDKPVTGKNFVGRAKDVRLMCNLIGGGENVALWGEARSGKMSLVRESLSKLKLEGKDITIADVNLIRARTLEDILLKFASTVIRSCAVVATNAGYGEIVRECLPNTHFVFDKERFSATGELVSTTWLMDETDVRRVVELPALLAERYDIRLVVLFEQFQSILFSDEADLLLKEMEKEIAKKNERVSYIFTGSRMNAMKEVFVQKRFCWRTVTRFEMNQIEAAILTDHMYKGLMATGKVAQKEQIMDMCETLRCNPWYCVHLFSIVEAICRGYVNKITLSDAMSMLISIHQPRFFSIVCSLTDFQLRMLKAIVDGETRFSSSSVIDKYSLNSSANVKRLKDALCKKEVVWFDSQDEPHIQDPLFEYWLINLYFRDN